MKLDEAIRVLTQYDTDIDAWKDEDNGTAIKLGIEALKWVSQNRYTDYPHHIPPLAGETAD